MGDDTMTISLAELLGATAGTVTQRGTERFPGVGIDGRRLEAGELYVAIVGETHDGHDFCAQALDAGAAGLLVQRGRTATCARPGVTVVEVDDPRLALGQLARIVRRRMPARVVGITGSAGKTTTKQLTAAALEAAGDTLATEGSLNNETGVPLTMLRLQPNHRFAVLEMAMRGMGQIAYLRGLAEPEVAVVTNAGSAHVGLLGSSDKIAQAKSEIFLGLPKDGTAIYPHDDERLRRLALARGVPADRHLTFGDAAGAAVRLVEIGAADAQGTTLTFDAAGRRLSTRLMLPGRHNAVNATCALAIAHALGVDLAAAAAGLHNARPAAHRSEVLDIGGRHVLDDCYNANPDAMAAAIDTLVELARGCRAVAVIGDMRELGHESAAAHEAIGRHLGQRGITHIALLGEQAVAVARGIARAGGPTPLMLDDPAAVAKAVAGWTRPGDWILVKASRGMRLERVIDALRQELP